MRKIVWNMMKSDEGFSMSLLHKIYEIAKSLGFSDITIAISEKYSNEKKPHFEVFVAFGQKNAATPCLSSLKISYDAVADGELHHGIVSVSIHSKAPRVISDVLAATSFGFYDQAIRKYYKNWKTTYNTDTAELSYCATED